MIISNLNNKGGVGKTTNTIHFGAALEKKGYKVLFIDCDSQCDLTYAVEATETNYTIVDFLKNSTKEVHKNFQLTAITDNLHILAGSPDFFASDYKANQLREALKNPNYNLTKNYDFIFIDVPPEKINPKNVSPMEMALSCADYFIVPIECQDFSIKNLDSFINKALEIKKENHQLNFLGFYFTNVLTTQKIFEEYYYPMREKYPNTCFETFIRRDAEVIKATAERMTIFEYNPTCRASEDFQKFTDELLSRLENLENKKSNKK